MKIETVYTLKQPMSHIGENDGTASFLNTVRIANNGFVQDVFAYTGNAIRGSLRDCAARHLLDKLNARVKKKEFNILFSGGNISGSMSTDIDQAMKYRELLPMISLFGAGIGNQILSGKFTQGFALPVCRETDGIIPRNVEAINQELFSEGWKALTGTVEFTRFDDSKNVKYQCYIDGSEDNTDKDAASTQMRYEVEYFVPGAQLYHVINLNTDNDIEIGVFVTALKEFAKNPVLGGMGGKGFGMCDAVVYADGQRFAEINGGTFTANDDARGAMRKYDEFIELNAGEIRSFLGAVEK